MPVQSKVWIFKFWEFPLQGFGSVGGKHKTWEGGLEY